MYSYDENKLSSENTESFFVALGCFWGVEAEYGAIDGVVRTSCGYAGGDEPNPEYRDIKDHTETTKVEYSDEKVSYRSLVEKSLDMHNPKSRSQKRQYDNIIFYESKKEKEIINQVLEDRGYNPDDVETRVEQILDYYYAEDYHQKYNLKSNRRLEEVFLSEYSNDELRDSALATKINAFAAGKLDEDDVPEMDDVNFNVYEKIINRFR